MSDEPQECYGEFRELNSPQDGFELGKEAANTLTRSTGSLRLQCHRCGWEGVESELDVNEHGEACPKCPQFRDIHASLSIIENRKSSHE